MHPTCPVHAAFPAWLIASLCFSLAVSAPAGRAQETGADDADAEVLTRGPVHEAFANVVNFRPEPGLIVPKAPPEPIEELPPEERPEGDDVVWIPGYWAWDDERADFLWISGTWRALPPGRAWVAGYWNDTGRGFQWISGYWADESQRDVRYLPPPPESLENGPGLPAPSVDFAWTPGCWLWRSDRYAWRPGYWRPERVDWIWMPASYSWTPRGYIFCDGYWDYPVVRRGVLFAPVYYRDHRRIRPGYYSPRIVISLAFFTDYLFLRPNYGHYYFGDYYDPRYERSGFFATFSYQSRRTGYDPYYSHARWEHRDDREWDHRNRESFRNRRDNPATRPPRVWSRERDGRGSTTIVNQVNVTIAAPLQQVVSRNESGVNFRRVGESDRQQWAQRGREVQRTRDERRSAEGQAPARPETQPAGASSGGVTRSPAPSSPFTSRSSRGVQAVPAEPNASPPNPNGSPRAGERGSRGNEDRGNRGNDRADDRDERRDRSEPAPQNSPAGRTSARQEGVQSEQERVRAQQQAQLQAQQEQDRRQAQQLQEQLQSQQAQRQAREQAQLQAQQERAQAESQRQQERGRDQAREAQDAARQQAEETRQRAQSEASQRAHTGEDSRRRERQPPPPRQADSPESSRQSPPSKAQLPAKKSDSSDGDDDKKRSERARE